MSDPFTLDQLRTFVAVHETGNFTAAARSLRRVQSAVSSAMANLEEQLGVVLWDRSTRIPTLTESGKVALTNARRVLAEADSLRRTVTELIGGLEANVSLCVDALFPSAALAEIAVSFAREFPSVELHVSTETMSAVSQRVIDRQATVGVVSPLGVAATLEQRRLAPVRMIPVVSPRHPLAKCKGPIQTKEFANFVQIVLSERGVTGVSDQAVLSTQTWRITDLHTKRELIVGGAGWGNLPHHLIRNDLATKRLVPLRPAAWAEGEHTLMLSAIFRPDTVLGPAHRWLLASLEKLCVTELAPMNRAKRTASKKTR